MLIFKSGKSGASRFRRAAPAAQLQPFPPPHDRLLEARSLGAVHKAAVRVYQPDRQEISPHRGGMPPQSVPGCLRPRWGALTCSPSRGGHSSPSGRASSQLLMCLSLHGAVVSPHAVLKRERGGREGAAGTPRLRSVLQRRSPVGRVHVSKLICRWGAPPLTRSCPAAVEGGPDSLGAQSRPRPPPFSRPDAGLRPGPSARSALPWLRSMHSELWTSEHEHRTMRVAVRQACKLPHFLDAASHKQ
ncbi:hypothetical protein NDU88_004117 [Pleurodeles waltl]|uniref:Uncharacterized protein n=1 Tax=Pleurodeles waltl TaxID=8319 RepID=A0AAV7TRP0_PLEWA|nr:hypothetical protein NDU88_004117 [Pleurodeles waltl]